MDWKGHAGRRLATLPLAASLSAALVIAGATPVAAGKQTTKTISFATTAISATEGVDAFASVELTRTASNGPAPVTVTLGSAGDTAVLNTDYSAINATQKFRSGRSTLYFSVPLLVNGVSGEADKTLTVTIASGSKSWTIAGSATATLTIHDDPAPTAPTEFDYINLAPSPGVNMFWNGSGNTFTVYRSTTSGNQGTSIGTATEGVLADSTATTTGQTYYYTVLAENLESLTATSAQFAVTIGTELISPPDFGAIGSYGWVIGTSPDCIGESCTTTYVIPAPSSDTNIMYAGLPSALLGENGDTEGYGYAYMYHDITIPSGTTTLSFNYYPTSTDSITFDGQEAWIADTSGTVITGLFDTCSPTASWQHYTYNLSSLAGSTVRLVFRVYEDGAGDPTSLNVDSVHVLNLP